MKRMNGYKKLSANKIPKVFDESKNGDINWVDNGAVTPVKNQGQCGSCWAFSAVGSIEGAEQIKTGTLTSYSEQQLVDCAGGSYGNLGCNGGDMDAAFKYVEDNEIETEANYPYKGVDGTCAYDKSKGSGKVVSYNDVTPESADQLTAALQSGPVSVAIEADKLVFQMYHTGVLTSARCGTNLDHGVLVVGCGTEDGTPFFLVKNSWGGSWGESGYLKISSSSDNICAVLSQPSQPTE